MTAGLSIRNLDRQLWVQMGFSKSSADSTIAAFMRALPLYAELERRGLWDPATYRDTQTGRKARSIVQEVVRLALVPPEDCLDELVDAYLSMRAWPIGHVRAAVTEAVSR